MEVFVHAFDDVDKVCRVSKFSEDFEEELMGYSVKCFDKVNK